MHHRERGEPVGRPRERLQPGLLLNVLNEDKVSAEARALGIHVTESTQKFAGQNATCISATVQGPDRQILRHQPGPLGLHRWDTEDRPSR